MTRIKVVRNHKQYKAGQTLILSPNEAFGLVDAGVAEVTKDMTADDYRVTAKVKRKEK